MWRLPSPLEIEPQAGFRSGVSEATVIPTPASTAVLDGEGGGAAGGDGEKRYAYLGSMPDLQSSELTALAFRAPLLAAGLGNGRITLWRWEKVRSGVCATKGGEFCANFMRWGARRPPH